jgi:hypothetical protein
MIQDVISVFFQAIMWIFTPLANFLGTILPDMIALPFDIGQTFVKVFSYLYLLDFILPVSFILTLLGLSLFVTVTFWFLKLAIWFTGISMRVLFYIANFFKSFFPGL